MKLQRLVLFGVLLVLVLPFTAAAQEDNLTQPCPTMRGYHQMVYDSQSDRVILFGGELNAVDAVQDTWVFDAATNAWTEMSPSESPPQIDTAAYDSLNDRVIAFVGNDALGANFGAVSETWAYNVDADTWHQLNTGDGPAGVMGARMVFDSESNRMILFGGMDVSSIPDLVAGRCESVSMMDETWAFDFDTNTWTKMEPAVSPPGRSYHNMVYDAVSDRVVLFGGTLATPVERGSAADMWAYDFNTDTWEALEVGGAGLPALTYSSAAYDEALGQIVVFGGVDEATGAVYGNTWAFDVAEGRWAGLSPLTAPTARGWHAMTFNEDEERFILFGGGPDRDHFTNETWTYDPIGNNWTVVGP